MSTGEQQHSSHGQMDVQERYGLEENGAMYSPKTVSLEYEGQVALGAEYDHGTDFRAPGQPSVQPDVLSVPLPEDDILVVLGGALFRRPGGGRERGR